MTTTIPAQLDLIEYLKAADLRDNGKIMMGAVCRENMPIDRQSTDRQDYYAMLRIRYYRPKEGDS